MQHIILQYYCQNCNNILKESDSDLNFYGSDVAEPCPYCDMPLLNTLQKRPKIQQLSSAPQTKREKTIFQRASSIPKLTLGIPKIDSILHFLSTNQIVCISGIHTQKIIERLCVWAQMPVRYGGFTASSVLIIDGANSSDIYQCTNFAKLYGMNVNKVLQNIISSRVFTVYQLANLITNKLVKAINQYNSKIVIISNLLYFFTDNNSSYLDKQEMKLIIKQIVLSLQQIKKQCLVIVSLEHRREDTITSYQYEKQLDTVFSNTIHITHEHGTTLSIHITSGNNEKETSKQHITLNKKDLETVEPTTFDNKNNVN